MSLRVGILTVSTSAAAGLRAEDISGAAVREVAEARCWRIERYEVIADDRTTIANTLTAWADLDVIFTTGGTGLSASDVTPEATLDIVDKTLPGVAEAMRAASLAKTPRAMLSRAVAGARGSCLIVNLPGSPRGARECLEAVAEVIPHAVEILQSRPSDH